MKSKKKTLNMFSTGARSRGMTIRLGKRVSPRRLNFHHGPDRLASMMALWGFAGRYIAETCKFSSPSLVYYRNHRTGIRIRDFREGRSPMAALVVQRMLRTTGQVLDQHLERMEEAGAPVTFRVPGVRISSKSLLRRVLA